MIRPGLCCMFRDEPITFVTTTATSIARMKRSDALAKLSRLCLKNADALFAALQFCAGHGSGCFRINSRIPPIRTHPDFGYQVAELPEGDEIVRRCEACGQFARKHKLRTSFHPDQFVVLNSQRPDVVGKSLQELEYQAEVSEWVGADVINIHGGGGFGNKQTVENDDRTCTAADLLPFCRATGIPLVYDVHHHRCNHDGLSETDATELAIATWNREPMFHISSPIEGWTGLNPERHHDFIEVRDVPNYWHRFNLTAEVEAKAKTRLIRKSRT